MAFKEEYQTAILNGTTPVTLVAAPAAGEVIAIRSIHVDQTDDAEFEARFHINKNSVLYGIIAETIPVGFNKGTEVSIGDNRIVLSDIDESLEAKMDGPISDDFPLVTVHFAREG